MRILNLFFALIFASFAALQYNDPDPWRWALMYGFVAAVFGFAAFGKTNRYLLWVGIAVSGAWMLLLLPDFLDWVKMGSPNIAEQMKAETPYVEYTREFLGLLICLSSLTWLLWQVRKK